MDTAWHLIQFTTNPRRKEPRNIGVAADVCGKWVIKLFAVDDAGHIDGRALRRFGLSRDAYADWVQYYTHMLTVEGDPERVLRTQQKRPAEFRLIPGGRTQSDCTATEFIDRLYRELVATDEAHASESWARQLKQRVETVLRVAEVHPQPDVEVPARWGDEPVAKDAVKFDYQYTNGQLHLMDRLQFHRVSIEEAKGVAREFHARVTAARAAGASKSFVAFYSGEALDAMRSDSMLSPLFNQAKIVDVDQPGEAAELLHKCLHLNG